MLNEIGSLFGVLKYVCDIVVKKFTFAISSPDEFLSIIQAVQKAHTSTKTGRKKRAFVRNY